MTEQDFSNQAFVDMQGHAVFPEAHSETHLIFEHIVRMDVAKYKLVLEWEGMLIDRANALRT